MFGLSSFGKKLSKKSRKSKDYYQASSNNDREPRPYRLRTKKRSNNNVIKNKVRSVARMNMLLNKNRSKKDFIPWSDSTLVSHPLRIKKSKRNNNVIKKKIRSVARMNMILNKTRSRKDFIPWSNEKRVTLF